MLSSLRNMFKVPDLRNKILFTLLVLASVFSLMRPIINLERQSDGLGNPLQGLAILNDKTCT